MTEFAKYKRNYATERAYELTKLAIENNMITPSSDPKETALKVYEFFDNLTEKLIIDSDK
ncbi:hypothetical protein [Facklamia sp. P12955]|uniref:hypothetical protein n=1 Tax=unclassified Facklamia TaxID=2622293 RepID=UPI003D16B9FC